MWVESVSGRLKVCLFALPHPGLGVVVGLGHPVLVPAGVFLGRDGSLVRGKCRGSTTSVYDTTQPSPDPCDLPDTVPDFSGGVGHGPSLELRTVTHVPPKFIWRDDIRQQITRPRVRVLLT